MYAAIVDFDRPPLPLRVPSSCTPPREYHLPQHTYHSYDPTYFFNCYSQKTTTYSPLDATYTYTYTYTYTDTYTDTYTYSYSYHHPNYQRPIDHSPSS